MTRVLWLDIDARFVNPTRTLLPVALATACDVSFFGPGHTSESALSRGLLSFIETSGPFDLVASSPHVSLSDVSEFLPGEEVFRRSYAYSFSGSSFRFLVEIARDLERVDLPRVGIFLETDYYNWTAVEIDRIERRIDYVIGFAPPFWIPRSEMPHLAAESFAPEATDAWWDWLSTNPDRVVPMLPMIDSSEVAFGPLSQRPHAWSVLGIGYAARAEAASRLAAAGLSPLPSTRLRRAFGALKRIGFIRGESDYSIALLNFDFQRRLSKSRASYTCGSGLGMPIRKFFEIPAAGAVLVCRPFSGFQEAGFRDGVNAIVCEPKDILDVHDWLEANPDRAQAIADSGRSLVIKRHSVVARASQFADIFARAARREPMDFRWEHRRLVRREQGSSPQ